MSGQLQLVGLRGFLALRGHQACVVHETMKGGFVVGQRGGPGPNGIQIGYVADLLDDVRTRHGLTHPFC